MSLPSPGSPAFVPSLLAYLSDQPSLHDFRPDPILFSTILLSLIVAKGGLIIDVETSKEGETPKRAQIKRVAAHIAAITCGIFGRTTHHTHLDESCSPLSLPHHLIVPPHSHFSPTSSSSHTRSASRRTPSSHTSHSGLRYVSAASHIDPTHHPGLPSRHSWRSHSSSPRVTPSITPKPSTLLSSRPITTSPNELEEIKQLGDAMPILPEVLILTGLEETDTPVWIKLVEILLKGKVDLPDEKGQLSIHLPLGFFLIWVRDAQNADHPSYLMDQFLSSTTIFAGDIPVPPPDIPLTPLIPPSYLCNLFSLLPYTHIHPPLQIHISNLICAVSAHPRLRATITGRVLLSFTEFVRAHRILASPFRLPEGWEEPLHHLRKGEYDPPPTTDLPPALNPRHLSMRGYGLGGGKGGVDTWGDKAGQEPDIRDLRKVKDDDEDGEQWYATPDNVVGVWQLCMRHRVKGRGEMDEIMWAVKKSAVDPGVLMTGSTMEKRQGMAERVLDELITKV